MRCTCCNKILSDFETTLRHATTGVFLDTCKKCLTDLGIPTRGRSDLEKVEPFLEEEPLYEFDEEQEEEE